MACLKLTYQKNKLEVNKNYFKKELSSIRSLNIDCSNLLFGMTQLGRYFTSNSYRCLKVIGKVNDKDLLDVKARIDAKGKGVSNGSKGKDENDRKVIVNIKGDGDAAIEKYINSKVD